MNTLRNRYSFTSDGGFKTKKITLPYSRASPTIVYYDAKEAIMSLLTDPRIGDDDYLFFGDNQCQPPPDVLNYVGDLNTGLAYTITYEKLIENPAKQVLLPIIFYIDVANTGQFTDSPITAVKMSLGIFKRKSCDKNHFWRILGYIPEISKYKSRGRRITINSQHVDSVMAHPDALESEGEQRDDDVPKAQDLHTILDVILEFYVKLQEHGFIWDLAYKDKVYENIEFVL